eukprot:1362590-Heterocapsa_arctica.AAC.1
MIAAMHCALLLAIMSSSACSALEPARHIGIVEPARHIGVLCKASGALDATARRAMHQCAEIAKEVMTSAVHALVRDCA